MSTDRLAAAVDPETVLALAGPLSFDRGIEYVEDGRVGPITELGDAIEATVTGTDPYQVRVSVGRRGIEGTCSCPVGRSGAFCKHCVALAAAWAAPMPGGYAPFESAESAEPIDPADLDVGELRRALTRATRVRGFLEYRDVPYFAREVRDVADEIDMLIDDGRAEDAIGLTERGLERVEQAIQRGDDSDGLMGDLLARFETIHLRACRAAHPEPVALARRLFTWELEGPFDVFRGAAERYAEILGPKGLAEYRRLAEERWATVPERGPGEHDPFALARRSHEEFAATSMMESLARASGDVDELIAVMSRDLSYAYQYLRIADVCLDAGRPGEALTWLEAGLRAFPEQTDVRLRQRLADEYIQRSRNDEAMALMWAEFVDRADEASWRLLIRCADRVGEGEAWRARSVEHARQLAEGAGSSATDGTLVVRILTLVGRIDEAWEVARRLGCRPYVLMSLARASEQSHPDDALAVYRDEIAAILRVADRRAYVEAVALLAHMLDIMVSLGRAQEFRTYAAEVREANKRRRVFLGMFDAAGLMGGLGDRATFGP